MTCFLCVPFSRRTAGQNWGICDPHAPVMLKRRCPDCEGPMTYVPEFNIIPAGHECHGCSLWLPLGPQWRLLVAS